MARGRRPEGAQALSNAERQARYRMRHQATRPVRRDRQPVDRRSLAEQWKATIATLLALQTRYVAWHDAIPEALLDTPTGEALQAIVDLDLDDLAAIEPPCGFGRD
jgi:hypothetical protein